MHKIRREARIAGLWTGENMKDLNWLKEEEKWRREKF